MKNNCLSKLALNASGKLQPQILEAIASFVNNEIYEINANMVRDRCISMNSTVNWSGRLPAICNGMRNTSACGAIITSEDRDFGGFTIRFNTGNTPALDTSNSHKPPIKHLKESNKTPKKTKKSKMTQTEFMNYLVDVMHVFSPKGRKRIYSDLTKVDSQILCFGNADGQKMKGVTAFGKPNRDLIEKRILEKYSNTEYIDKDIYWEYTSGIRFNLETTKNAFKIIIKYLSFLKKNGGYDEFIDLFLRELKGNNYSLMRLLSQLKYKSKIPGNKLVGKQTVTSNVKNKGYVLEHTIPAKYLKVKLLEILESDSLEKELDNVMSKLFSVWLNTDDDIKLKRSGLNSKMPVNWTWKDDPLERYWSSGIDKDSLDLIDSNFLLP